jgi:hypothetical protein
MGNDAAADVEDDDIGQETKQDRFLRVAERRTNNVLYRLRVLSNCANRHTYEYSDEDVRKIFDAIDKELKIARSKFETSGKPRFSFRDEDS